jgi:hypothetical protein
MANGYIGKISALVTASTADLSRKLQGGTRDVNRFANSVQSQIAGAASSARRSFEGIFTPLQRIQRALEAGRGSLNIIDDAQVRRFQQAVSIAEQINKPLAAASRAFQGLSADVAAGLLPALLRAQDAATRVNDEIGTTGGVTASSYRVAEQAIDRAAAAFERFRQAEQIIGSAPRGRELQFDDPQLFEALQRSADARRGAAAPGVASRVGGALGDAVREVARFDDLVAQAASRISGIRLAPQVDTSQLERAQGEYQDLLVQQRRAVEELNRLSVAPPPDPGRGFVLRQQPDQPRGLGLFGRQAGSEADAAVERAQRLDAVFKALPQSARAAVGGLAGIAARVADEVATAGTGVAQLNAVLDILEGRLSTSSAAAAAQAERVRQSGEAAREAAAKLTSLATAIQAALGNARPTVDSLEQDFRRLLEVVQKSPAGRTAFKPILDELLELFTAARNGADNLDQIIAKLNQLRATGARGASGGLTILSDADVQADKAKQAARTIQEARDALSQRILGGFGGAGADGISLGIDERQVRGIAGEFDFLQTKLAGVAAEARGPLVAAMENYRQVVTRAFRDGTTSTQQGQAAIAAARAEVVRLGADLTNTRPGRFAEQLNRAGDAARGFGSRFGLAIQQAVFAVDDFFSVSGGLDQQIRAAGNNISQLGFILGGTAGLIAGVSVAIGGQLAAAVIRYRNGLVAARDEAESLNATLRAQRDAVKEVADEFDQFINDIVDSAFSEATRKANEFTETLDGILERLKQIESESIASLDPTVIRERAIQQSLERRTGEARNVADILALQDAIERSRQREQAAANRAVERGPARQEDFAAITDTFVNRLNEALRASNDALGGFNLRNFLGRDSDESAFGLRGESLLGVVQPAIGSLIDLTGFGDDIRRAAGVQSRDRVDQLASVAEATRLRVEAAGGDEQQLLAAVAPLREELDRLLLSAGVADRGLVEFAQGVRLAITQVEASLASPEIREANKVFGEAARASRNVGSDLENIRKAADEAADAGIAAGRAIGLSAEQLGREFKAASESLKAARAAGDPAATRVAAEEIATVRVKIEAAAKEAAAIDIARQALDRFAAALDLASQEAQSNLQSAQQAADEARRADLGRSTPATRQARQQADADLARQRELATNVEEEVAAARERGRAGQSPAGLEASVRRIRGIDQLLSTQGVLASGQPEELARERARLEQQVIEADEQVRRARDESTAEAEQAAAAVRGRELSRTDGERAAADLTRGLEDIRQFFGRQAEETTGLVDFEAQAAAQQRFIDQSLRSAAPAIFGLADQVQNAVLQGPSRAALEATDVSTVEGSRELNRLLRGDDSARDQNLVELQKQSQALDELVRIAREGGVEIAN